MNWNEMPSDKIIEKTADAVRGRGIDVIVIDSGKEALDKIKEIIPKGAEVSSGSSTTLNEIEFMKYLESGGHDWINLHKEILKENDKTKRDDLRRKMVTAEYFLGSVNAIAQTGELVACDASGSRVTAYPYAAKKVILVAGAQKIVPTLEDAMKRIHEYVYPLEDARAMKAYGMHSTTGKWVIIEREITPERITLILVKEKLGY